MSPRVPSDVLVESSLLFKRESKRRRDPGVGRAFGRPGPPVNQFCDVSARYAKDYRELLIPLSDFSRLPAVEHPESLDGVGEVADVVRRVSHLGSTSQSGLVRCPQSVVNRMRGVEVVQQSSVVKLMSQFARGSRDLSICSINANQAAGLLVGVAAVVARRSRDFQFAAAQTGQQSS